MTSPAREEAASLLAHYFGQAMGGRDESALSFDGRNEIRYIVDRIVEAAKEEMRHELQDGRLVKQLDEMGKELHALRHRQP